MEDPVQPAALFDLVDQQGDFIRDQGLEHHFPHDGDGSQEGGPPEFPQGLQPGMGLFQILRIQYALFKGTDAVFLPVLDHVDVALGRYRDVVPFQEGPAVSAEHVRVDFLHPAQRQQHGRRLADDLVHHQCVPEQLRLLVQQLQQRHDAPAAVGEDDIVIFNKGNGLPVMEDLLHLFLDESFHEIISFL